MEESCRSGHQHDLHQRCYGAHNSIGAHQDSQASLESIVRCTFPNVEGLSRRLVRCHTGDLFSLRTKQVGDSRDHTVREILQLLCAYLRHVRRLIAGSRVLPASSLSDQSSIQGPVCTSVRILSCSLAQSIASSHLPIRFGVTSWRANARAERSLKRPHVRHRRNENETHELLWNLESACKCGKTQDTVRGELQRCWLQCWPPLDWASTSCGLSILA